METQQTKAPSVLGADLSCCNLDVVFQAGGSSRKRRLRQQYTYSIEACRWTGGDSRLTDGVTLCVSVAAIKAETTEVVVRNMLGAGGSEGDQLQLLCSWEVVR